MNQEGISSLTAAAHELKAPLALVRQYGLVLRDASLTDVQREQMYHRIILTSERSLRLTTDLTKAARLEDAFFEMEPVNPEQVCRDVITELSPLFEEYGRSMSTRTRKHPLLLVANRDLLRRIVLHFADNALHYSQQGTAVELQITALKKANMVRVGVRDYGPALSSKMWRELQDKLATAPQSVHARPESSGLGLYISSQFAEAMNGKIGAVRHRDGATFYIDLPASYQLSIL